MIAENVAENQSHVGPIRGESRQRISFEFVVDEGTHPQNFYNHTCESDWMSEEASKGTWRPEWRDGGFLDGPRGICVSQGVVYVSDLNHNRVRGASVFDLDRVWDEIGREEPDDKSREPFSKLHFMRPRYIWRGLHGEFYLTSTFSSLIYEYRDGKITVKAGNGIGRNEGDAEFASFHNPRGGCVDPLTGDIYIADFSNDRVRVIRADGKVASVGNGARQTIDGSFEDASFMDPNSVFADTTGIYVAQDTSIRLISPAKQTVSTFAGSNTQGFQDGPKLEALFYVIYDIKRHSGKLYLSDSGNHVIRIIDAQGMVSTLKASQQEKVNPFALDFLPQGHLIYTSASSNRVVIVHNVVPSNIPVSLWELTNIENSGFVSSKQDENSDMIDIGSGISIHRILSELAYPTLAQTKIPACFPDAHLSDDQIKRFLYQSQIPRGADAFAVMGLITIIKSCSLGSGLKHDAFLHFDETLYCSQHDYASLIHYLVSSCNSDCELAKRLLWHIERQSQSDSLAQDLLTSIKPDTCLKILDDSVDKIPSFKSYERKKLPVQKRLEWVYWIHVFPTFSGQLDVSGDAKSKLDSLTGPPDSPTATKSMKPNFKLISSDGASVMVHDWLLYCRWPFFRTMIASGSTESQTRELEMPNDPEFSILALKAFVYYLYTSLVDECDVSDAACLEILQNAQFLGLMTNEWPSVPSLDFEPLLQRCRASLINTPADETNCIPRLKMAIAFGTRRECIALLDRALEVVGFCLIGPALDSEEMSRLEMLKCKTPLYFPD